MSNNDSFIEEVSEEVRRDRMYALWRRYGPFVIGGIVAVVALVFVKNILDERARDEARRVGGALIAAGEAAPAEAAEALTALAAQTDHAGAALLARLRAAGALAQSGDVAGAAAIYDAVAADSSADELLQDFAAFRALALRAGDLPPQEAIASLEAVAAGFGPFRLLALEAQAGAFLRAGDRAQAIKALREIAVNETAPQGLRQRAAATLGALGAEIEDDKDAEAGQG